jgi:hypothetical protein
MNRRQEVVTRTEHILMSPALYALPCVTSTLTQPWHLSSGLGHVGLRPDLSTPTLLPGVEGGGVNSPGHQCGAGCAARAGTHVLKPLPKEAQARFTTACQAAVLGMEAHFFDSLASEDVEGALAHLMSAAKSSADSCGLLRLWQCLFARRGVRNPVQQKPWYSSRCAAAKLRLRQAIFEGQCPHARRHLRHEYR